MNALGYVRVSKVGGREGDSFLSPNEQRKAIDRVAKREGINIVEYLEELDASGGDNMRPKWNEAIERVESGEVKAIVLWNLSRFSRSTQDGLRAIERVENAGGALFSEAGDVGDNTPTGKLTRTIFLGLAQMERERARDSFNASRASAIERGIGTASTLPTGYDRDPETRKYVPNKYAPLIKELFERRASGATLGDLVRWFISAGGSVKTNPATVSGMLRNTTYLGWVRSGEFVNQKAHPPIVSRRLFDSVQGKEVPREHTGKAAAGSLLGGLVVCDGCGRRMSCTQTGSGKLTYRCGYRGGCSSRATAMVHELDAEVVERLAAFWNTFQFADIEREQGNAEEVAADLAEARERHADALHLLDTWKAGRRDALKSGMSVADYTADLVEYQNDVEECQIILDMAEAAKPMQGSRERVADLWDEWTHETRKEWLGKNVDQVIVRKSGQGRGNPIHVSERMALGMKDGLWLHRKAGWSAEPFGEPQSFLRIVARSKGRRDATTRRGGLGEG